MQSHQYTVGCWQPHTIVKSRLSICGPGYHVCDTPSRALRWGSLGTTRIFAVQIAGAVRKDYAKLCAQNMRILYEVVPKPRMACGATSKKEAAKILLKKLPRLLPKSPAKRHFLRWLRGENVKGNRFEDPGLTLVKETLTLWQDGGRRSLGNIISVLSQMQKDLNLRESDINKIKEDFTYRNVWERKK